MSLAIGIQARDADFVHVSLKARIHGQGFQAQGRTVRLQLLVPRLAQPGTAYSSLVGNRTRSTVGGCIP